MIFHTIHNCQEIDLDAHALIEASAGTGKTYTIENLVLRLLKEKKDIGLGNLLVVTFTEKATGELKARIRGKLEQAYVSDAPDSPLAAKIKDALDTFDTVPIHTIHGFCQTILQDFAFESQTPFQSELVSDQPLFESLLKEHMRKRWPQRFGEFLPDLLTLSGLAGGRERWMQTIVNIAARVFRPEGGDILLPTPLEGDIGTAFMNVRSLALDIHHLMHASAFSRNFTRLNIHKSTKNALMDKVILPLEDFFSRVKEDFPMADLWERLQQIQKYDQVKNKGFGCLVPSQWLKKGANPEVCPRLSELVQRLETLSAILNKLSFVLACDAIQHLQADVDRLKQQKGWISYDDMLKRTESALGQPSASALVSVLRKKYRYAFIDEFQDTDPVQWQIFKTLFLDPEAHRLKNRLFLIGDPKQAIYAFRGADVFTYLEAKNEMDHLSSRGMANLYYLGTNWRSHLALVDQFNHLFGRSEWFPDSDQVGPYEIGYAKVAAPSPSVAPVPWHLTDPDSPVLQIMDLRRAASARSAKVLLAENIAAEITHLVHDRAFSVMEAGGIERPVAYDDICILVRGQAEVGFLEAALGDDNIPYSYYKKPGLFQSDEAVILNLIFQSIDHPADDAALKQALLTPFFNWKASDILDDERVSAAQPVVQLINRWHAYAESRQWGRLFQSLLEDTGFVYRESVRPGWERSVTNYIQILEHLFRAAYNRNLDFRGLTALLNSYLKQKRIVEDEADIHQIETEAGKVQLMTMHASKGLEFPIVFIAGGITQPSVTAVNVFHVEDETGIHKVIDLSKASGRDTQQAEAVHEDQRLFYVALTRARMRLYVPYYPAFNRQSYWGPACGFFADALKAAFMDQEHPAEIFKWQKRLPSLSGGKAGSSLPGTGLSPDEWAPTLSLPHAGDHRHKKTYLTSFSSLRHESSNRYTVTASGSGFEGLAGKERENDEMEPLAGENAIPIPTLADQIPGGTEVGSMFHEILEEIDYQQVADSPRDLLQMPQTRDLIRSKMRLYRLEEKWEPAVADVIANTLTTPITAGDASFLLGHLPPTDRLHEVEFFFPYAAPKKKSASLPQNATHPGQDGYIHGFIDLIFRFRGKIYLADWKSNRVPDGYTPEVLKENMEHAAYTLQYQIYALATNYWLGQRLGRQFDPHRDWGGIFYFYLRGLGSGEQNGIYFVSAEEAAARADLETALDAIIETHPEFSANRGLTT